MNESTINKSEVRRRIEQAGILPVVRAQSHGEATAAMDALLAGGITVLEITMTVPGAVALIEQTVARYGNKIVVGVGSVLDAETARICTLAGAQFVVSPTLSLKLIEACRRHSVTIISGALTPTEVVAAWQAGADAVKVFPCDVLGGARYLKALKTPLPHVEMIPTGGVSLANAADFIKAGAMALGIGGELVDLQAVRDNRPQIISDNARKFLEIVQQTRALMLSESPQSKIAARSGD